MFLSALCLSPGFYWLLLSVSMVTSRTCGANILTHPRRSLPRNPCTVYIVLSYITMMVGRVVFCMIITQFCGARFPKHFEILLFDAVVDPIKAHGYCFGPFFVALLNSLCPPWWNCLFAPGWADVGVPFLLMWCVMVQQPCHWWRWRRTQLLMPRTWNV